MSPRGYRLGRRQGEIERTRSAILSAARELVSEHGPASSMGKIAHRAGVSRITVYNQFGSKERLLEALAAGMGPPSGDTAVAETGSDPRDELRRRIEHACSAWAADPSLYRRLEAHHRGKSEESDRDRALAERFAAHDLLRPGCSVKEAEDVIGILMSFSVFDRLHKDGRRSPSAVAEILMRMAGEFLAKPPSGQT
ncbi:MAG TPA: helix-turn-helix domain-containing protein [Candidatus Eisenbacteria bacterium]|nr:helix-turn-helix domain-containing protein [Candidatus Eisenbacteria bacterium]